MKVILTIGAPQSGHLAVFDRITQAGVVCAAPCRDASLSPQNLQARLLRSMEVNLSSDTPLIQLTPGRLWNELASDLFLTNIDHPAWGWADHQSVCLMDFWREFDPQVRLLLVYNSPLAYLQQVLCDSDTLTADAIAAALATWSHWNTALLRYFHRHPQHCLLVNSQQAVAEPAALIELLKTKWQIAGLTVQESTGQGSNQSDLLTHLISQMLDPQHPAWALHQELESVAQLTVPATAASNDPGVGIAAAWAEWAKARTQAETASQEQSNLIAAHADLTRARDQLGAQLAAEAKAKAEAIAQRDAQASAKAQAIAQRDAEAKSKAEAIAQRDAEAKAKAELQAQVAQAAQAAQASAKVSEETTELKQENELLLLQLHQVQEELEHYFLRYQEIERQQQSKATGFVADFWRMHQPQELVIDMQQDVTGNNWYPAESDGRWAGPAALSTLQMPPLQAGNYTLELDIVDAMSLAIVNNLVVEALGQTPPVEVFYPLYQGEYPLICKVPLTLSQAAAQQPWSINLRFHQLVCPADTGADANDRRNLSMRLRSVKLVKQS